jgi:hypothetical protein
MPTKPTGGRPGRLRTARARRGCRIRASPPSRRAWVVATVVAPDSNSIARPERVRSRFTPLERRKFETCGASAPRNGLNLLTSHNLTKMAVVQLRRRKWPERGRKQPKVAAHAGPPWFGQLAGNGRIPRASGPDPPAEKECPDWTSWRRESSATRNILHFRAHPRGNVARVEI